MQETTNSSNSPPGYLGNSSATASILSNGSLFSFVGNASQNGSASCDDCFTVDAAFQYADGALNLGTLPQSNGTSSNPGVSVTPLSGGNEQVNIVLAYQLTGTALPPNPYLTNGAILLVAVGTASTIQYIYTDIEAASPDQPVFTYANVGLGATGSSPKAGLLFYQFTVPASTTTITLSIQAYVQASSSGPSTMTLMLNPLTCSDITQNLHDQLSQKGHVGAIGSLLNAYVTAPQGLTMANAADICGFTDFDWVQTITSFPSSNVQLLFNLTLNPNFNPLNPLNPSTTLIPPISDPPSGGYKPDQGGCVNTGSPYYYDPKNVQPCNNYNLQSNIGLPNSLNFLDSPFIGCGTLPVVACYKPGEYTNFQTQLVGVLPDSNGYPSVNYDVIGGFGWRDNYEVNAVGSSMGGAYLQQLAPAPSGGIGGAVITEINGVPVGGPLSSGGSCNGTFDGTFNGDVTVSAGQNCTFTNNCEIKGNVTINGGSFNLACMVDGNVTESGGSLILGPSTVKGNVQISRASDFAISPGAAIGGNLQIQNLSVGLPQGTVCGTQVKGNLQAQNNSSPIEIGGSTSSGCPGDTVGGNLLVDANTASVSIDYNTVAGALNVDNDSATTDVSGNSVGKNMECQGNNSVTYTARNMVSGQSQGQCAAFP